MGVRPSVVRRLKKTQDLDIGELQEVKYLTNTTSFSGLVIIKGGAGDRRSHSP
jgi:hypothetical protein